jgi:hypothetical protein
LYFAEAFNSKKGGQISEKHFNWVIDHTIKGQIDDVLVKEF